MTETESEKFRRLLEARRQELEQGSRNRESMTIEASPDELDRIQNASEREYAIGEFERDAVRLGEVRRALIRIRAGTFGVCEDCEGDINPRRLAAVPWAAYCIACQEARELQLESSGGRSEEPLEVAA